MSAAQASFQWEDPFMLHAQLSDDERQVADAARAYCEGRLMPRVRDSFRHETTDLAIFSDNSIKHSWILALGGNNLTNDIAVGLQTALPEAEKLKQLYGCTLNVLEDREELIEMNSIKRQ